MREEPSSALTRILSLLNRVRSSGNGFVALCPAHDDRNPSLSLCEVGGKILLNCFAQCTPENIVTAIGLTMADLFVGAPYQANRTSLPPIRVQDLARDKHLATEFLQRLGVEDTFNGVRIPYRLMDGSLAPRQRIRTALAAKQGSRWEGVRDERIVPYGLWRLAEARAAGFVVLVEGESDCWTLWHHGFPALGIPGAATAKCLQSEHLAGLFRLYVVREPDSGGAAFISGNARSLRQLGWRGRIYVVSLPNAKDPNDLHKLAEREFKQRFQAALDSAQLHEQQKAPGFTLTRLSELLKEPDEKVTYVLAGKLPTGGISVLSAKPKVGKSTMARCLAIAVAKGETFLGCATTQGPVIYLALEEKRSEVRDHFRKLGATGEEPIHIHAAAAPQDALSQLCKLVEELKPVLVIIDPLFKFVRVRDEKAYAEVCAALEPLLSLARESGAHVLLTHHSGKADRIDATDAILGSTAIFGGVDSAIILKKYERYRTVQSSQRYGTDWSEAVLEFDPEDKSLTLGVERTEAERDRVADSIVAFLCGCLEPQTREQIEARVEGKTKYKRAAIRSLVDAGRIIESGTGTKGDPFRYEASCSSTDTSSPPRGSGGALDEQETLMNSCSFHIEGTGEQESQKVAQCHTYVGDKVVPELVGAPTGREDSREQVFQTGHHGPACGPVPRTAENRQSGFLEGDL
jgi:hypothetical protein